jgi:hypothetical protein
MGWKRSAFLDHCITVFNPDKSLTYEEARPVLGKGEVKFYYRMSDKIFNKLCLIGDRYNIPYTTAIYIAVSRRLLQLSKELNS